MEPGVFGPQVRDQGHRREKLDLADDHGRHRRRILGAGRTRTALAPDICATGRRKEVSRLESKRSVS